MQRCQIHGYNVKHGRILTLRKGGMPVEVPQKNGMLGHNLPFFFIDFTHENDKFSNKDEGANPMHPTLDPPTVKAGNRDDIYTHNETNKIKYS